MSPTEYVTELRLVSSIIVDRETRQRSSLDKDVETLADSIRKVGLLNPIVIHADGRLIAGERRLAACKRVGLEKLRCTIFEKLPDAKAYLIELLENIARKQLSWQDEARAVLHYHKLQCEAVQGWNVRATGGDVGLQESMTYRYLRVAERLSDPEVAECQSLQGAFNLLRGRAERATAAAQSRGLQLGGTLPLITAPLEGTKEQKTAALEAMLSGSSLEDIETAEGVDPFAILDVGEMAAASLREAVADELAEAAGESPILTADFIEWAQLYEGPKFDVLHVDFPYGKEYKGSNTRRTGRAHIAPLYKDDPDVLWELLETLLEHQDRIAFPVAHCLFWFDMEYYTPIRASFEQAGWTTVQPYPLIWAKPYQGVASDTKRRPRHCYETALLFSRGDRRLVRVEQDFFEGRKEEGLHLNQKSIKMLKQFLSIVVDEHTAVLDPTCGSGTALAASRALGAKRILGLELDSSNAEVARFVLARPEESPDDEDL